MAVRDRLGQPGGTGGEQDPQRVPERHLLELEPGGRHRRVVHQLVPGPGAGDRPAQRARHLYDVPHAAERADDLRHLGAAVVVAAAVAVAVHAEQDLRCQLAEPVADPPAAEIGRAAGPDRADARRGQHRDRGRRDVRHAGGDPVARTDAHLPQPGGQHPHGVPELGPGQAGQRRGLRLVIQGVLARPFVTQNVLRVVQPGPGEPVGARHRPAAEHRRRRGRRLDAAVVPDRLPEAVEVGHRPAPQGGVVVETPPAFGGEPPREGGHVRAGHPVRTRRPQQVALADLASRLHIADGATAGAAGQDASRTNAGLRNGGRAMLAG